MERETKFLALGVVVFLAVVIIWFSTRKKTATTTKTTTNPNARTTSTASSGGGYTPITTVPTTTPTNGFTITGVGQTVTGLTNPQTVTAPARVINLTATPSGTYSGTAILKNANGTVLHTETITNLNISAESGAYPAIYFNPTNPVWNIQQAGTYVMEVTLSILGVNYTRTTNIFITNEDLGLTSNGISLQDYAITNGNEITLNLIGGTIGENVTVQLKQGDTVVGSFTGAYVNTITITSSQYGYLDVLAGTSDLGTIYAPQQIGGNWSVQKAKTVDETGWMNLQFTKVGSQFVVTDSIGSNGLANVEYWHNATYLGATIPSNYAVEPNIDHHFTKKGWGNGGQWISYEGDPNPKQKAQLTFKIVPQ